MQFGGSAGRSWALTRSGLRRPQIRCSASSTPAVEQTPQPKKGTLLGAALISGGMSVAGDVLAQVLTRRQSSKGSKAAPPAASFDWKRTARMGGYGLILYGPGQHWWYGLLDRQFPLKQTPHFLAKVAANQLFLGPAVVSSAFAWHLCLTRQQHLLKGKLQRDWLPAVMNGWKLWIPAACVNFFVVPLQHQVLWMSSVSVLWTAYLSYASNQPQAKAL